MEDEAKVLMEWHQRGQVIAKLSRRIHRLRSRISRLTSTINRVTNAEARRDREVETLRRQNAALIKAARESGRMGLRLQPGEDRLAGALLIIQKLRERELELFRAATESSEAISYYMTLHDGSEFTEGSPLYMLRRAGESCRSVIDGNKSLTTQEIQRRQEDFGKERDNFKAWVTRMRWAVLAHVETLAGKPGRLNKADLNQLMSDISETMVP